MNRSILRLAAEGMKGNKRNSMLRLLILFLSFTFITVSLSVTASLQKTGEEYRYSLYGAWNSALFSASLADKNKLEENVDIKRVGMAAIGGVVTDENGFALTALGSLDDELLDIGRISLQAGRIPAAEGEIAMEADVLSALGYDYTLGQRVICRIQRGQQSVEKEYTLCGVVKEYTDIWPHQDKLLSGAIVDKTELETLGGALDYQYFLVSEKTNMQLMQKLGKGYSLLANEALGEKNQQEETYLKFVLVILAATVAAVCSLYFAQMNTQIRSFALLRTIGATKKQLIQKMLYEIACITAPAVFGGSVVGGIVTRAVMSFVLSINREKFYLVIPFGSLALSAVVWLVTVGILQLLVLHWAFRQPLVGRIASRPKRANKNRWFQNAGLIFLMGIFFLTGSFVYLQSQVYLQTKHLWENMYDYQVEQQGDNYVTEEELREIEETSGVRDIFAVRQLQAAVSFADMENSELVMRLKETEWQTQPWLTADEVFPKGIGAYVYGIRESDIEVFLTDVGAAIDREAFVQGTQVIMWFGNDENLVHTTQEETGLCVGDEIIAGIYATGEMQEDGYHRLDSPVLVGEQSAEVGEIIIQNVQSDEWYMSSFGGHHYSIIASQKYVEKLIGQGFGCGKILNTGDTLGEGFSYAKIKTGADAAYVSTDYTVSGIVQRNGNKFVNQRELHAGYRSEAEQGLLFLWLAGLCVGMILLLLIWNILIGVGKEERKKYGILRAIGMSNGQMIIKHMKIGLSACMCAMFPTIALCILGLNSQASNFSHTGVSLTELAIIWGAMSLGLLLFYIAVQAYILRGTPMQLIRGEER